MSHMWVHEWDQKFLDLPRQGFNISILREEGTDGAGVTVSLNRKPFDNWL